MRQLAPDLFDRRFKDLLELGRARLPWLAPDWTDHNAHDPGITLMELLAWVAESQLYSLSRRPRRDERAAYAALLGIAPKGTEGASGLIWSDRADPDSPVKTFAKSVVLGDDTVINMVGAETPTFRPVHSLLWAPGRITRLESRDARGRITDHTTTNERGGLPFAPFGERAGRRDVLRLSFECRDDAGLFGSDRRKAIGAYWPIGVLAASASGGAVESEHVCRGSLAATLITDTQRFALTIASDTTQGFLTTGALLLDLDSVTGSPTTFTIEFRAPGGFARPPRVLRVEPNVVPVRQGRTITREPHPATGMPDLSFTLDEPGLRFASGEAPVKVEVGSDTWRRSDRLSDQGPDEDVFELDTATGRITFGNGINGRIPPADSQALVTYAVSDGERGRVARNRKWKVAGFGGTFGVNPDPIGGGAGASGSIEERREARRRAREEHALVSKEDIEAAAKALPLLEVARAWVAAPDDRAPRTGVVTLVAMRSRAGGETARWLESIRRRLAPRMPLGSRIAVVAPRYVGFSIGAELEIDAGRKPSSVEEEVAKELKKRLALVDRQPGVPVTPRDVAAWMRSTDGVKRVARVQLRNANGRSIDDVAVPRGGLPRWDAEGSTIEAKRAESGRAR